MLPRRLLFSDGGDESQKDFCVDKPKDSAVSDSVMAIDARLDAKEMDAKHKELEDASRGNEISPPTPEVILQ